MSKKVLESIEGGLNSIGITIKCRDSTLGRTNKLKTEKAGLVRHVNKGNPCEKWIAKMAAEP